MSAHLWQAAEQKARQLATGCRVGAKAHRGELGLTIHDWCEVLGQANRARRTRNWLMVSLVVALVAGFVAGRLT